MTAPTNSANPAAIIAARKPGMKPAPARQPGRMNARCAGAVTLSVIFAQELGRWLTRER